ncbi:hypothetical protein BJV74DRAFT_835667 [Russula compacta]|nr:hypothetical protein BJV74DRAFT_835667 [Russula compacta]
MGYVRSHKFCCCIPVRLGVFVMSTVGLLGATIVAAVGWHSVVDREQLHLSKNQDVSLVLTSISYSILAIVSLFGLIGTIIKRRSFISSYGTVLYWHLGFNLVSGVILIFTLFHKVGDNDVNTCVANDSDDSNRQEDCQNAFKVVRGLIIAVYIIFWLLELWGCVIVGKYVEQLQEEEVLDYPPPAQMGASAPPMATTYNYGSQYAFSQSDNSYGKASV